MICKMCEDIEKNWDEEKANKHFECFGHLNWRQDNRCSGVIIGRGYRVD